MVIEIDRLQIIERRPFASVLMEAQKVIDPDRQRPTFNGAMVSKLNKKYQAWINEGKPGLDGKKAKGEIDPDLVQIIVVEKPPIVIKEPPDLGKIPTVVLFEVLKERVRNIEETQLLMAGLQAKLDEKKRLETTYDHRLDGRPPTEKPKPTAKPVRVCVLGISPDSIKELKDKAVGLPVPFELSFRVGGDFAKSLPKQDAVDYVLVTGNHAGKWMQKLKDAGADGLAVQSDDSVQNMVQRLYDIASRQTTRA
jgi:hypothetical protein